MVPKKRKITVALDATGISLRKYGGWLAHKWKTKKVTGWIKLHAAVDVDTDEILAFVITDETVGDISCTDKLMELVMAAGHDVGRLLADAGYDSKENWRKYTDMGIKVCINIKSPQLGKFDPGTRYEARNHGCLPRGQQMRRILEIGRDEWKKENGYGMRWKVECTFSDLKRILTDILSALYRPENTVTRWKTFLVLYLLYKVETYHVLAPNILINDITIGDVIMISKKGNRYGDDRVKLETVIPIDTPFLVFIDPSSSCNLRCKFCPCGGGNKEVWAPDKKPGLLSYETYRKIIDDMTGFPNRIKTLRLYKEGEPLMNKRLPDMIAYARKKDIAKKIDFTTNGTLLTHDLSLALMDAGVDRINISVEALNSENYLEISGVKINYDTFYENLEFLYKHKKDCHIFIKISDGGLFGSPENDFYEKFYNVADEMSVEHITPVWPEFNITKAEINEKYDIYGKKMEERKYSQVCPYLFYSMCINSDASISACLMDWNHKLIIGNAMKENICSVWNGPTLKEMRLNHLKLQKDTYPTCKECGQLKYAVLDNIDDYREEIIKRL